MKPVLVLSICLLLASLGVGQQVYSVTIGSVSRSFSSLEEMKSFVAAYVEPTPPPAPEVTPQVWPPVPPTEALSSYPEERLHEIIEYQLFPSNTYAVLPTRTGILWVDSPRSVTKSIYRFDVFVRLVGYNTDTFEGIKVSTGGFAGIWMPTYTASLGMGRRREPVGVSDKIFWTPMYVDFRNSPTGNLELRIDSTIKHATGHTTNLRYPLKVGVGVDGPRATEAWGFLSQPEQRTQSAYFQSIRLNGVREFTADAMGPITVTASARNATDNAAVGNRDLLIRVMLNGAVLTERVANSGVSPSMKFMLPHPPVQAGDVITAWLFDNSQPDQGSAVSTASVTIR